MGAVRLQRGSKHMYFTMATVPHKMVKLERES